MSAPGGPDETPAQAVKGLKSFVDQATGQSLVPFEKMGTTRNLGVMLGGTGLACIANYQATWVLMAALVPVVYLLTMIEERELRVRFGEQYARYAAQVPRIIPRRG